MAFISTTKLTSFLNNDALLLLGMIYSSELWYTDCESAQFSFTSFGDLLWPRGETDHFSYSNCHLNIVQKGFACRQCDAKLVREGLRDCVDSDGQQVVKRIIQPLNEEERGEKYEWAKRRGKDRRRGEKRKCTHGLVIRNITLLLWLHRW